MALTLKVSNSLKHLAISLCEEMKASQKGVFQPDYIITQTEGMNNWLKLQLAENLGIAANYRFLKPNDLIHEVYRILGGQYVQPLSSESQSWLLFSLLNEKEFKARFKSIARYYTSSGIDQNLKRMALAAKIADLFDQYQIYRHEMIKSWNTANLDDLGADDWQQYLWIRAKAISGERLPDKTTVGDFILRALETPSGIELLKRQMPAAHIFGLSVTTRYHIELFHYIGKAIDLSFHLLNPSPEQYWFEDKSEKRLSFLKKKGVIGPDEFPLGNELLTNWGKVIQNTFYLLFNYEDLINEYDVVEAVAPASRSLLAKIQTEIFENRMEDERAPLTLAELSDGSITINSCYTPAREVEVLYNYLVHLIDQRKEELSPREIVVMVSDIDTYAPYIKAIFKNAPYEFYFSIADESYAANDSIGSALQAILSINEDNFKAESVLQLLDSGYIRRRFGLSDLSLIRKAVDRANIRFGIEGSTNDDSIYVSWKYGLQRIVYGLCMSGEEEYLVDDESLFPLDLTEGSASRELISFCHFAEVLIDSIRERKRSRSIADWASYMESLLVNFLIDPLAEPEEDYELILKQLEDYSVMNPFLTELLDFDVFSRTFLTKIDSATRSGSFAIGGITFCSLIPMRSIPFKVVALLGLNHDKFPRKENPVSFNLMEKPRRKGDRNVKDNDKHLFLETLLSAEKYLYISYIGQNVSDNSNIPPSALVDELMDYIRRQYAGNLFETLLFTAHPLHGFSNRYASNLPAYFNYLDDNTPLVQFSNPDKIGDLAMKKEISLSELIRFFRHPIKGYYNNVLAINYHEEEVLLSDSELFELNKLQQWNLRAPLLNLADEEQDQMRLRLLKTGKLPLKNMSHVVMRQFLDEISVVKELFLNLTNGLTPTTFNGELRLQDSGILFKGSLTDIYYDKIVLISWSADDTKFLQEAYFKQLFISALELPFEIHFISSAKQKVFKASALRSEDAIERLESLIELYTIGHSSALPFWSGFKISPDKIPSMTAEDYLSKISKVVEDTHFPCTDQYVINKYKSGFFNQPEIHDRFLQCAGKLISPLSEIFADYYG